MNVCVRHLLGLASLLLPLAAYADPMLSAKLVDRDAKAQKGEMTVEVSVTGLELLDAAKANEQPHAGQGHLHYRLDEGPVIATTATKLSFHELGAGAHQLEVRLAGNDHKPIGVAQNFRITVPAKAQNATAKPAPPAQPAPPAKPNSY
jgi:hypothetical protein